MASIQRANSELYADMKLFFNTDTESAEFHWATESQPKKKIGHGQRLGSSDSFCSMTCKRSL
jgi:SET domain-containing protein